MTILEQVVSRVEMPGRTLSVEPALMTHQIPGQSGQKLIIEFEALDATGYHEAPRTYRWDAPAPNFDDETACARWVFQQIVLNEIHELQEFFKMNGEQVFDPHTTTMGVKITWP